MVGLCRTHYGKRKYKRRLTGLASRSGERANDTRYLKFDLRRRRESWPISCAVIPSLSKKCIPDYGGLSHDVRSGFECTVEPSTAGAGRRGAGFLRGIDDASSCFEPEPLAPDLLCMNDHEYRKYEDRMATLTAQNRTTSLAEIFKTHGPG